MFFTGQRECRGELQILEFRVSDDLLNIYQSRHTSTTAPRYLSGGGIDISSGFSNKDANAGGCITDTAAIGGELQVLVAPKSRMASKKGKTPDRVLEVATIFSKRFFGNHLAAESSSDLLKIHSISTGRFTFTWPRKVEVPLPRLLQVLFPSDACRKP
jgi:hypothetical protein